MSEMIYKFKPGARVKGSAQIIGGELERIREEHGGLTAKIVVDEAKPKGSPLHNQFQWNDKKAAEEYRLQQARHLVAAVTVVWKNDDGSKTQAVRLYHATDDRETSRYLPIHLILGDAAQRARLLEQALDELNAFKKKYADLSELSELFKAMEKIAA